MTMQQWSRVKVQGLCVELEGRQKRLHVLYTYSWWWRFSSCDPVRPFVTLLRVHVPGCAIGIVDPAAIMIGWSVLVCFAFVNLSLSGCDAVLVWERVNMAGAGEVRLLRVLCRESFCLFLCGFSIVSILTRSHTDSKASGLLCPRVLTALQMAP